jgi:hypothetical protein
VYTIPKPVDEDQGYALTPPGLHMITALLSGENSTDDVSIIALKGSEYVVPKPPENVHLYAIIFGGKTEMFVTARASPVGENAAPVTLPAGRSAGLVYFVPNPVAEDQTYALTYGLELWPIATALPAGGNATAYEFDVGNVAGFENLVPKPEAEVHG